MKTSLLLVPALLAAPLASAANPWDAPFSIQIGAFRAAAETNVRLDSDLGGGGNGTHVNFEADLGLEDAKTLPALDFTWRWNPRHGLEGSYVQLKRNGSRSIDRQINWGDVTFPVGATVDSRFESNTIRVAYRYSPINDSGNELALLLGLHYTKMKASLGATVGAGTGTIGTSVSDEASVDYPLPTIGIRGSARLGENIRVTGFTQLLKLKIDEYDGELLNAGVGIEWAFMPQAYAGVGYNYYKYDLTSEKANARGQFDYVFDGPTVYLGWSFR